MNLLKLRILVLIEKYKKVTDVANELQMKQPTVTFHMKSLEEELGVSLYQTRGGRVWLSEAGKVLYPYAQKMTSLLGEAERTLEQFKKAGTSLLRLGAEDAYSVPLLRAVRGLEQLHPKMQIEVRFGAEADLAALFAEGVLDAVLMEQSTAGKLSGRFEPILEDELVIIYSKQHKWAEKDNLTVEEIRQSKFIGYDSSSYLNAAVSTWAQEQKIGLLSMTAVSSFNAAVQAVELGMGIAFASRKAVEGLKLQDKEIAVFPLGETLPVKPFTIGLLAQTGEPVSPILEELSELIKADES